MDLSRIYTKTSRGILDGALKTRALGREHGRLFALIDGKASLEDLIAQNTRLSQNHLAAIIDQLVSTGLIRLINEVADIDDLGFSSTIIVSEANTQAFFDAQIAADIKSRLAEVEESLAQDKAREALLQEVTSDIAAEAEALKRQEAKKPAQKAKANASQATPASQSDPSTLDPSKAQSRAEVEAHAKAVLAESNARMAKQKKSAQEQHEAQIKAREELDRVAREEAKKKAQTASLEEKAAARESKLENERASKAIADQERCKLEAKIIAEEEAQRNAELDAHFLAIEGASTAQKKDESAPPKALDQSHIAAELDARVKRRLEARAREEAAALAKAQAEEAARIKAAAEAKRQAEAEAAAAQLEAERKARLEAEQKAQAEAAARAQAEAAAQAQAEEAARVKAAEEAKRQAEATAAQFEAEQRVQAEAEARTQAESLAAEAAAQIYAAEEEVKLQAAAAAKLEAEAIALVAEAEEAVRQEAAAVKRQMGEQQQEEEARRVRGAAEQEAEAELQAQAQADKTVQSLANERAQMESAALAREQEQIRAREDANAKARAEMEEALRREHDARAQEQNEEDRLREEAQTRALAAAQSANLSLFAQKKRKPLRYNPSWNKPIAKVVLGVLLLGVALAHLLPFNFYIPKLERQLSDSLGQRVKIETLRFSAYPSPHLELEGVVIGDKVGARMEKARLFPTITAWFSDVKMMRRVELDSFTLSVDSLEAFPLWSRQQAGTVPFQFERLLVKNGKFKHPLLDAFMFDAEMDARRGKFLQAKVISHDQRINLNFVPQADALRIDLQAKQSVWPLDPRLTLESLKLTAISQDGALSISNIEAQLFEGYATGTAKVSWSKGWTYNAELSLLQIAMEPSLARFTRETKVTGTLEAKVRLAGQADTLDTLFGTSQVQATYRVKNGDYSGIDLVRAIQAPRRGGHIGGKTNFSDLSGFFQYSKGRTQLRQIKLQGGVISASGNLEISQDNDLSGNLLAELNTPSARFRSAFIFSGTLETPVLKPFVPRAASATEKSEPTNEAPAATNVTQPAN